nr:protein takeout-like [Halyomorpha halys]
MRAFYFSLFFVPLITAIPADGNVAPCSNNGHKSEACIRQGLNRLISSLVKKWKEKGSIEPLLVGSFQTDYSNDASDINLLLKNVVVSGLSSTVLRQVKWKNLEEGKLELMCKTDWLSGTGTYWSEGYVSTFPVHSQGIFNITLGELTSLVILHLDRSGANLKIRELKLDTMPSTIDIQTGTQLDGNNALGETLNMFLNENSYELFELVKPRLLPYFSTKIKELCNSILIETPVKSILPILSI